MEQTEERKLELVARKLANRILQTKGIVRSTLVEVPAEVTWIIGRDQPKDQEPDPIFWFDKKGRFCTRAKTPEEIKDSMILMGIAEGVTMDIICQEDAQWEERLKKWDAFEEMKCKYLESLMRIKELEEELKEERYRHDRYVDFELAQAEELRKAREALRELQKETA